MSKPDAAGGEGFEAGAQRAGFDHFDLRRRGIGRRCEAIAGDGQRDERGDAAWREQEASSV